MSSWSGSLFQDAESQAAEEAVIDYAGVGHRKGRHRPRRWQDSPLKPARVPRLDRWSARCPDFFSPRPRPNSRSWRRGQRRDDRARGARRRQGGRVGRLLQPPGARPSLGHVWCTGHLGYGQVGHVSHETQVTVGALVLGVGNDQVDGPAGQHVSPGHAGCVCRDCGVGARLPQPRAMPTGGSSDCAAPPWAQEQIFKIANAFRDIRHIFPWTYHGSPPDATSVKRITCANRMPFYCAPPLMRQSQKICHKVNLLYYIRETYCGGDFGSRPFHSDTFRTVLVSISTPLRISAKGRRRGRTD